jgi:hypothetical protein
MPVCRGAGGVRVGGCGRGDLRSVRKGSRVTILIPSERVFETVGIELVMREIDELKAKCRRDGLDVSERYRLRELVELGRGCVDQDREGER